MVQPQDHMVLVRVAATRRDGPLVEFSGVVEGIGEGVQGLAPGDEVRGTANEVFADYVCVPSGSIRLAAHD
jgi:NADPH:quinone reductase-like Zn-dependent oxidoreductase